MSFHTAADVDSLVRHYCVVFFVPRRLAGSSVARFPVAAFTASSCPPVCPSSIHCVHWTPSYSCYHSHYYHISCEERVVEFCCWSTCCQSNRCSDCCRCHRYWPCLHSMLSWSMKLPCVCLSVCPVWLLSAAAVGLLVSARRPGYVDRLLHSRGAPVVSSSLTAAAGECGQCHFVG